MQEDTGKYSQISILIPNSVGPNPKQLQINNENIYLSVYAEHKQNLHCTEQTGDHYSFGQEIRNFFCNMLMPHSQKSATVYYSGLNKSISHLPHFSSGL
jgi:hypothetical protein